MVCFLFEFGKGSFGSRDIQTKESGTRGAGILGDGDTDLSPQQEDIGGPM